MLGGDMRLEERGDLVRAYFPCEMLGVVDKE